MPSRRAHAHTLTIIFWLTGLALVASAAGPAAAADCVGATVRKLAIGKKKVSLQATITAPGLTHDRLAIDGTLTLILAHADDAADVRHTVSIPASELTRSRRRTKYKERSGRTRVLLNNWKDQDSTVFVKAKVPVVPGAAPAPPGPLRLHVTAGRMCARSCATTCTSRGRGFACTRSTLYMPAVDLDFGALAAATRQPTSFLCGLEIAPGGETCEFLIEESCLLPYPSSHFLVPDASTPTGVRLRYGPTALPADAGGRHIDPTDWNTLDGFSPGSMILALFPDTGAPVDLEASGAAPNTDFARSLEPDHPTLLLDAATGERIPHFVELDANTDDVTKKALIIRPGRRLGDGTRYLVAIRSLVDVNGAPIPPRLAFRALRDGIPTDEVAAACGGACAAAIDARRARYADILTRLEAAGVATGEVVLAWDFTTASTAALTDWIVAVRDQAFAHGTPVFGVDRVEEDRNASIWTRIEGTFQAPLFMTADAPGARLNLVGRIPRQNGFATVPFVVDVPRSAVPVPGCDEDCRVTPARPTLWGHGLLGTRFQLGTLSEFANVYNYVIAAVDMQGMSRPDVEPSILPITQDLSLFHRIPERLHQGFLNHLLLGRLLLDPERGFNSHPAFRFGSPQTGVIDTTEVYYSGGSQGGIFGVAIMSIAEDFKRGFLAVPGANYSTLLRRSIDFNPFLALFRTAYPDPLDETLAMALLQQLWDRAEPQGYMSHLASGDLSEPPVPHQVLIHMATHDSEVSNLATEIMVRSLGIPQLRPVNRSFFGIPEVDGPIAGSAFVEIDPRLSGGRCHTPEPFNEDAGAACSTDADCPGAGDPPSRTMCASGIPPLTNQAPLFNNRAHGSTGVPAAGAQIAAFLRPDGRVVQFCEGPCDPE